MSTSIRTPESKALRAQFKREVNELIELNKSEWSKLPPEQLNRVIYLTDHCCELEKEIFYAENPEARPTWSGQTHDDVADVGCY